MTMKRTTLIKRLDRETDSNTCKRKYMGNRPHPFSKNSYAYQLAMTIANGARVLRPCLISGSGRYAKHLDYTRELKTLLDYVGIKYEIGNDSPRGGFCGTYLKVLTDMDCTAIGLECYGYLNHRNNKYERATFKVSAVRDNCKTFSTFEIDEQSEFFPTLHHLNKKLVVVRFDMNRRGTKIVMAIEQVR